jgi:hypothetical protein
MGGSAGAVAGSGGANDAAMGSEGTPPVLSQAGLFEADMTTLSSGVRPFSPRYQLWSDAATKRRWIWLPEGMQINTTDMEYWEFPVGTRLYKEFSLDGRRIETRRLEKRENGSWSRVSYLWRADMTDADAVPVGAENASGTEHDVPSAQACGTCHLRMPDKILGFSAVQLAHDDVDETAWTLSRLAADGKLSTTPPSSIELPGDETSRAALGYLHANCGHCHHPLSVVTSRIQINLWLRTDSLADVLTTPTYQTTVNQTPLSETQPPSGALIIDPGSPETSTLFLRVDSRGAEYSMPPLATEEVDPSGRDAVGAWIRSLGN